jgi:S-adenosylmethionine-diacylgycerolhomoserine-N-methlytransferase
VNTPASLTKPSSDRRLMDSIYRRQRHIYDVSRRYYLLGRDRLVAELKPPAGGSVLEIGCGTGRNLIAAAAAYPQARFFGLDLSEEMLKTARAALARHRLSHAVDIVPADAVDFEPLRLFGVPVFSRIFFSYTLSMIPPWERAIAHAWKHVAPGGQLFIVDFGQSEALPPPFRAVLWWWLAKFHVTPRAALHHVLAEMAREERADLDFAPLYGGYAWYAVLTRPAAAAPRPAPDGRETFPPFAAT